MTGTVEALGSTIDLASLARRSPANSSSGNRSRPARPYLTSREFGGGMSTASPRRGRQFEGASRLSSAMASTRNTKGQAGRREARRLMRSSHPEEDTNDRWVIAARRSLAAVVRPQTCDERHHRRRSDRDGAGFDGSRLRSHKLRRGGGTGGTAQILPPKSPSLGDRTSHPRGRGRYPEDCDGWGARGARIKERGPSAPTASTHRRPERQTGANRARRARRPYLAALAPRLSVPCRV